ncbi:MAG: C-terminal target protein, partial [Bacteroidetes bacterium]|nr:C-terminal target protein [Bacteroidota bacterium]
MLPNYQIKFILLFKIKLLKTNTFLSRSFLVFCLLISVSVARAQYVPLPDSVFGNWLNNHGYTQCLTGNGTTGYQLDTTCGAVITATSIDLSAISVFDLTGIRYFRSLTDLNCSMSHLTTMAPLPPNLQRLDCSTNSLTSLGTLPARLTYLDCGNNRMTSMILPPRLDTLWCNNNLLDSLPTLTDSLKVLFCFSNRITSISSLPATLTGLACFSNRLTSITAALPSIMNLSCASNTDLYCLPDITHNLIQLQINGTHITCLSTRFTATSYDVNPATMPLCGGTCDWDGRFVAIPDSNFGKWLYQNGYASSMRGNALTSFRLDTTSGAVQNADTMRCVNANIKNMTGLKYFTHLVYLDCSNNQLTDLSVVPATLKSMYCDSNQLRALPSILPLVTTLSCRYNPSLYCLPAFNAAQLNGFYIGNTNISCVVAPFTALAFDTDPSSLPICRSACITTGIYVDIPDSNFGRWLYNNGYDAQLIGVYGARRRLNILGTVQYATAIDCPSASITNLEGIQYFTSLSELDCTGNLLDSLPPLPSSLTSLICRENHLTGIAPLPAGLGLFWCNDNQLPQLPQLPASLTNFYCYNNLLDSLPLLPAGLSNFSCSYNRLRSLPALPSAVYDFF